jgi:hypothetical protein
LTLFFAEASGIRLRRIKHLPQKRNSPSFADDVVNEENKKFFLSTIYFDIRCPPKVK